AEVAITARLREAYPDALILGEEATETESGLLRAFTTAEHAFTIDPVDGTKNFVRGSKDHAVMVAELREGRPVRSWILQPESDVSSVAEAGSGVYRKGGRMQPAAQCARAAGVRGV